MSSSFHSLLTYVGDLCFPPSTEELLVRSITPSVLNTVFLPRYEKNVWSLSRFHEPVVRALIHEAKFHSSAAAQRHLADLLRRFIENQPHIGKRIWIPIPLSKTRLRERGFNQVEKVLLALSTQPLDIQKNVLVRTRHTPPQTSFTRGDRLHNVRNAFSVQKPELIEGRDLVLIDDVITTGATVEAATLAIEQHRPASIICIALARS
jgi:ComF family protein